MKDIFVGRQPIYDSELQVLGYELLFRSSEQNSAGSFDDVQATSQVIVNTFVAIGLDQLVGKQQAFINLSKSFFEAAANLPFPTQRIVFEVLESTDPDETLQASLQALRDLGYHIALDDFIYDVRWLPIMPLVDYVKLDVLALPWAQVEQQMALLRNLGVKLLAEKVEDQAMFQRCKALGFHYFQGYFLSKPEIIASKRLPPNQIAMLQLLVELQNPEVDVLDLEKYISRDLGLSYDLLKFINSAYFNLPRHVDSIHQAVVFLGNNAIKRYVSLLVLAADRSKPTDMIFTAMWRGKMCELLAQRAGRSGVEVYFTVGLFSMLEALLQVPVSEILAPLPLAEDTKKALLSGKGPYGELLAVVLAYEKGEFWRCRVPQLAPQQLMDAYLAAIQWADEAVADLKGIAAA